MFGISRIVLYSSALAACYQLSSTFHEFIEGVNCMAIFHCHTVLSYLFANLIYLVIHCWDFPFEKKKSSWCICNDAWVSRARKGIVLRLT